MSKYIAKLFINGVIQEKNEDYCQKWLLEKIEEIADDKKNVALVLFINSPGGSVYESDEVFLAVKKYREDTKRPVYAYFANLAASGGYYIGCSAQKIIANRNTITGSIGVIAGKFIDATALLAKHGVKSETIHAGRNKIMGSIDVPVTDEQRAIMQSIADECYEQFTNIVSESRNIDIAKVKELADGRIYSALQAKENGLVDGVMSFDEAIENLKECEFKDKEYKAEVKDFKYKPKKSLKQLLKGSMEGLTPFGDVKAVLDYALKNNIRYPAFLYEQQA